MRRGGGEEEKPEISKGENIFTFIVEAGGFEKGWSSVKEGAGQGFQGW